MKPYDDARPKGAQVEAMFDGIAPVYDRLNDIMSLGIARRWRRAVVKGVQRACSKLSGQRDCVGSCADEGRNGVRVLDLATGTGDLAIALARRLPDALVTGADPSEGMLAIARRKAAKHLSGRVISERASAEEASPMSYSEAARLDLCLTGAEKMPFEEETFDVVTASFGVRNFNDIPLSLSEMCRVMKSGGSLFILEFSTPRNRVFGALYNFYFHKILPRIGGLLSKDRRAYEYLPDSVAEFPAPDEFVGMLRAAGFDNPAARPLTGGVAYIYTAKK